MKPELVCKIEVRTEEGEESWGSGYPITPNRIITAAHVVADAARVGETTLEGDVRDIKLTFGPTGKTVERPVYLEWCDEKVDVAVLRCKLPDEFRPIHQLLTEPRTHKTDWEAKGFTVYGDKNRPNKLDDLHGRLASFAEADSSVALEAGNAPLKSKQWKGGSGSVAFDEKTQTALAVITDYAGGKKLDELIGVPLCYLLNSELTKDSFRSAIQYARHQEQKKYRDQVVHEIQEGLSQFSRESLLMIAKAIRQLAGGETSGIDLKNHEEVLAEQTAICIVNHSAVSTVVGCLVGVMQNMDRQDSRTIANIIDQVLPLNYAPDVIRRLQEQLSQGKLGIVTDEVATRTLAEIIMAGYEQSPAKYIEVARRRTNDIPGRTALDYQEDPESGPSVLSRVRDMLCDLAALQDSIWGLEVEQARRNDGRELSDAELTQDIEGYVNTLQAAIETAPDIHEGRRLYCVLGPPKDEPHRDARLRVLEKIAEYLPDLLFVELRDNKNADKQELKMRNYIVARLVRTQ